MELWLTSVTGFILLKERRIGIFSPNDMWELRRIGLISDNELQNTASYWLMRFIVLAEPTVPYYELIVRVARLTFSTGSRVRNIISRDFYGESISKLRETLKSK